MHAYPLLAGYLRPIVPSYLTTILALLPNYIVSLSLSHPAAPVEELAATLTDEHEIPRQVSTQIMSWFDIVHADRWSMDVDSVLKEIGLGVLRSYKVLVPPVFLSCVCAHS
jgi:sister chromatid cohesion protein DCC1